MKAENKVSKISHITEVVFNITKAQIKSRYRKTVAGFLWVILNPILTFVVQGLIFKNILRIEVDNYYLMLLAGVLPWSFLSSSMNMTVGTFINNRSTLMAFRFDGWILILAQLLDNFYNFIISFVFLLFMVDRSIFIKPDIYPLFAISVLILLSFTFFTCLLLSIINTIFRDTQFVLNFLLNLAYFVTPIFYPISLIPEKYRFLIQLNPLYIIIKPFQNLLWSYDLPGFWISILTAIFLTLVTAAISILTWKKLKNVIYLKI